MWKVFKDIPTPENYAAYRAVRNAATRLKRLKRKDFETHLIDDYKSFPKRIFAYVNRRIKKQDDLPALFDDSGVEYLGDSPRAELFADFFSACHSSDTHNSLGLNVSVSTGMALTNVCFPPSIVEQLLSTLDTSKSPGWDGLHPLILRTLAPLLSNSLASLFTKSLIAGVMPTEWKTGIIKPFHKRGSKATPRNYRPVCLTSIILKTMEKIIKRELEQFLHERGILSPSQHGFVKGRSCLTNLILTREAWAEARDHRTPVDTIFFDFAKAFDRIDHWKLLQRLRSYGIGSPLLGWIKCFLTERRWAVRVNGTLSEWRQATSGVPQGSVLGPLLFLIYVNDITRTLSSPCLMFADDLKLWREIRCANDHDELQRDIDTINTWALLNDLPLNVGKTIHVALGNATEMHQYYLDEQKITRESVARDLGVMVRSDLKTSDHSAKCRVAALRSFWALKRTFSSWSIASARTLYTAYVRPILEYGVAAAFPCTVSEEQNLERVQRLATRLVPELSDMPYPERCEHMQLYSLTYRRMRGDMILLFRVLCKGDLPDLRQLFTMSTSTTTRKHRFSLSIQRTDKLPHVYRLSRRATGTWNSLPPNVVEANSLDVFKQRLDYHMWTLKDESLKKRVHLPGYPRGW